MWVPLVSSGIGKGALVTGIVEVGLAALYTGMAGAATARVR